MTLQSDERVEQWLSLWRREVARLIEKGYALSPLTDLRSHEPPRNTPLNPDPAPTPTATRAAKPDVTNG